MQWSPFLGPRASLAQVGQNFTAPGDLSATWSPNRATLTVRGGAIGPNGQIKSARLTEDATAANTHFVLYNSALVTTTAPCVARIFARSVSGNTNVRNLNFQVYDNGFAGAVEMYCDLRTGAQPVAAGISYGTTFTSAYGRVHRRDNGWYECVLTFVPTNAITLTVLVSMLDTVPSASYSGDGASSVDLAGASLRVL